MDIMPACYYGKIYNFPEKSELPKFVLLMKINWHVLLCSFWDGNKILAEIGAGSLSCLAASPLNFMLSAMPRTTTTTTFIHTIQVGERLRSNTSLLAGWLVIKQTGSLADLPLGDTLAIAWIQDCISSSVSPWIITEELKINIRNVGPFLELSIPLQGLRPLWILHGVGILKRKVLKGEYEA